MESEGAPVGAWGGGAGPRKDWPELVKGRCAVGEVSLPASLRAVCDHNALRDAAVMGGLPLRGWRNYIYIPPNLTFCVTEFLSKLTTFSLLVMCWGGESRGKHVFKLPSRQRFHYSSGKKIFLKWTRNVSGLGTSGSPFITPKSPQITLPWTELK